MHTVPFFEVPVGAKFQCNGNKCEKVSKRTAKLLEYDKTYYFGRLERCTPEYPWRTETLEQITSE